MQHDLVHDKKVINIFYRVYKFDIWEQSLG